jgi:hypothetical protein
MATARPPASRQYYLQRGLRRAALWGAVGIGVIVCAVWIRDAAGLRPPKSPGLGGATLIFILPALFIAQYLLTRVRVNEEGIHRRILWWWDLWPWEAFTDGQVSQGVYVHGYRHAGKPFWAQRLELSALEPEAAKEIDALIKRLWTPPTLPDCPETLVISIKGPGRRTITLTQDGIMYSHRNENTSCRWADLPMVRFWRLEPDRTDFRRVIFRLADRDIQLRQFPNRGQESRTWLGPTAEVVSMFVLMHAERVEDYALLGDARTLEELEAKSEFQSEGLKRTIVMKRCCWGIAAAIVGLPLLFSWRQAAGMAALLSLYVLMAYGFYRDALKKAATTQADLDRQRELLTTHRIQ